MDCPPTAWCGEHTTYNLSSLYPHVEHIVCSIIFFSCFGPHDSHWFTQGSK